MTCPFTHITRVTQMGTDYRRRYRQWTGRDLTADMKADQLGALQWAWRQAGEDMKAEFMVWAGLRPADPEPGPDSELKALS